MSYKKNTTTYVVKDIPTELWLWVRTEAQRSYGNISELIINLLEKHRKDEYNEYAEDIDLQAFAQGRKSSNDYDTEEKDR
jgi:hypothetical protein